MEFVRSEETVWIKTCELLITPKFQLFAYDSGYESTWHSLDYFLHYKLYDFDGPVVL